ncbi:ESCRT-II complex subunit-domain-containing protein [Scheffersomyces coipomensis]|uniref:ESCRT-II complex subunit-domain-containing protein n=1 Tax=Scheffersomyces coipomensis TaxID=1788519 RepID=UPI00315CAF44
MTTTITDFIFPKIHTFPPLYTKQPNSTILSNQLDSWCQIILSYCEYYRITSLTINGIPKYTQLETIDLEKIPPIFENKTINRTTNDDFKSSIIHHLIYKLNKAEYINPKKPELGIYIYWRSLVEWGQLLYDYVDNSGQLGTVLTIYELTKSDENGLPDSLKNLDETLLIKIVKDFLIKQGKAQILMTEDNEIGGVKIV